MTNVARRIGRLEAAHAATVATPAGVWVQFDQRRDEWREMGGDGVLYTEAQLPAHATKLRIHYEGTGNRWPV